MSKGDIHGPKLKFRTQGETPAQYDHPQQTGEGIVVPRYWESEMLQEPMRHESVHGGSHTFLSAEFINALLEDRSPAVDVYDALAMTVPGLVAHQSSLKGGKQPKVPQFDRD